MRLNKARKPLMESSPLPMATASGSADTPTVKRGGRMAQLRKELEEAKVKESQMLQLEQLVKDLQEQVAERDQVEYMEDCTYV